MPGVKHLLECHCTLKIYEVGKNNIYHKFAVYSKVDNLGRLIEKIASCNNCGTLHRVVDICKSEILRSGKDENKSAVCIEDIQLQLPDKINNILIKYDVDLATWEQILDIFDEESWGQNVVISRDLIDQKYHVKVLQIISAEKIKILTKVIQDEINFN
jgi:D-ribose pyranose/furanose isomerase RbsD